MSEEQTKILQMLADGKITVDEATKLIDAAGTEIQPSPSADASYVNSSIFDTDENGEERKPAFEEGSKETQGFSTGRWTNWANNLANMDCRGASLDGAFFFASNIEEANFCNAGAEYAKFGATNLEGVNFEGANLRGARIFCANLEGANFRNANLEGVTIFAANLENTNFEGADLREQNFLFTNLENFDGSADKPLYEPKENFLGA